METKLKGVSFNANVYDIYKAVELALHHPNFYHHKDHRSSGGGQNPPFEVVSGMNPASRGRTYKGTDIVNDRTFRPFPLDVGYRPEKNLTIDTYKGQLRKETEHSARPLYLPVEKVQFGAWYVQPDQERAFFVEYEREYLTQSMACVNFAHKDNLICIDIRLQETEEVNYHILVKYSNIRQLDIGRDAFRQPFVTFDLHTAPSFEKTICLGGIRRRSNYKTREPISALDDAHARIAPYAHQLRVILAHPDDLLKFEEICHSVKCQPLPTRVARLDAYAVRLFREDFIDIFSDWIKSMGCWKSAFQIEACLRCGLLNTYDLLVSLQKPIEEVIRDYASEVGSLLRLFSVALRTRTPSETPNACLERVCVENPMIKPLKLTHGNIMCHHAVVTPSRILLEGPYVTQSNRVIRRYQNHDPSLVDCFLRVEFRDEDNLAYRWDATVDSTGFLRQRIGRILREGIELGGRRFKFLAYSNSSLREHAVWFVANFHDPVEGFVTANRIRASLGDFSKLLRTPSKYGARMALAFTATEPNVKIRHDQWEDIDDLGPHTDGVGTISPVLADMIWEEKCKAMGNRSENRVKPSAYQFRFLGYKGVVVVDSRLEGIKMRLRKSQHKFPVHNVEQAEFEIARTFDYPNPVHLNRPAVMALEDLGVEKDAFMNLQNAAIRHIYLAGKSLKIFADMLKSHGLGDKFRLSFVLRQLIKLKIDFGPGDNLDKEAIGSAFFGRLVRDSINHSLREVKFKARIPVPHSYQLVGVADEGQAYIKEGEDPDKVFTLKERCIYVCVQEAGDKEPVYFEGECLISRSPVIHPGDVQRVVAVGKPPDDKICFFRGLKNVVVLPAVGDRSLASCLAGGDLDGDTYDVYFRNPALIPPFYSPPADHPPAEVLTLDESHGDATIEDICDFIVEYLNSDVMGVLADRHIVIADQSKDGVFDERCMKLAALCSQAVDYSKNGKPVDLRGNLPKTTIASIPDWHKAEATSAAQNLAGYDYYVSDRALGHLYREIALCDANEPLKDFIITSPRPAPLNDAISCVLAPLVRCHVVGRSAAAMGVNGQVKNLYARYAREMRYICANHVVCQSQGLSEEEVVLGTILATCTQPRLRQSRTARMKLYVETLVEDMRSHIVGPSRSKGPGPGLRDAWTTWCWAQHHRGEGEFAFVESFALIALGVILDCLKQLGALPDN